MEAVILAGGFGTRLSHIVSDVPKPMAPVSSKPFLQYLLDDIISKGVTRIILAVGYKSEVIEDYFGTSYGGAELIYSLEDKPLFTGGAIKKALQECTEENVFVFNGDTFFDVDLINMQKQHLATNAVLTVSTKAMSNFDRYGTVECDSNLHITGFIEKKPSVKGDINGGVYLVNKTAVDFITAEKFSFETEYMEKFVNEKDFFAFSSIGYFIDIGIPEDYEKAQIDFK